MMTTVGKSGLVVELSIFASSGSISDWSCMSRSPSMLPTVVILVDVLLAGCVVFNGTKTQQSASATWEWN